MASRNAIAIRRANVTDNLELLMNAIAEERGLTVPPFPAGTPLRDPEIKAMLMLERVAEFLGMLVGQADPKQAKPESEETSNDPQPDESPATKKAAKKAGK